MRVGSKDYGRQYTALWPSIEAALRRTLLEDEPILGSAVERFEAELAAYHGVAHAIGVGSGTDAIVLALRELGLRPDDEVLTGSHTFSGVVSAIVMAGARPVLVEPCAASGLVDAQGLEAAVGPRTRAIVAVHLYGAPLDGEALAELCTRRGLLLIEDVAQAHGARSRGRPVGSFGRVAVTSFHPSKNLGAFGDGGAVLTDDATLADGLRIARNLGKSGKYEFARIAGNSKLDTLQAAILSLKLTHLESWVERRRAIARRYHAGLAGVGDLILPADPAEGRHAYHLYVVRTERREALQRALEDEGIRAGLHYPIAAPDQPALKHLFREGDFPVARHLARTVLTLPLSHEHEDAEIDAVIDAVRRFFGATA